LAREEAEVRKTMGIKRPNSAAMVVSFRQELPGTRPGLPWVNIDRFVQI
jgi:hypothetical protein